MIKVIVGNRDYERVKVLIDNCNERARKKKGDLIFIDKDGANVVFIDLYVRFVNLKSYEISDSGEFFNFVKGIIAGNSEIEAIFINNIESICSDETFDYDSFFAILERFSNKFAIDFFLTVLKQREELPDSVKAYIYF